MRNFDEQNITDAVLQATSGCQSERDNEIGQAVVRHLHALVKELRPTQEEWAKAIRFLTETGKTCSETRQEFILLSDTLGISMLVDAINHDRSDSSTSTTVLGPFYFHNSNWLALGSNIANTESGDLMHVEGTVTNVSGCPLVDASVEVWHADNEGFYDVQLTDGTEQIDRRANFKTDGRGRYWFKSRIPSFYPIPADGPVGQMLAVQGRHPNRPAHVHFKISAPEYETLITHVFLAGDPYLDTDVVFGVKDDLITPLIPAFIGETPDGHILEKPTSVLHYDFRLTKTSEINT